jgi:hypothetical protein
MVSVVGVCGSQQDSGVDQQHSVAPETLSQQSISLGTAPGLAGGTYGHERELPTSIAGPTFLGKARRESLGGQLVDADAAPGGFGGETIDQLVG